jgi:anti-sigma factor ChrR (cupin superfamily)
MDAVTPKGSQTADTHSHIVRPQSMEWQKTRFPGCEAKTLLFDRATGLMTALMRFAPGAVLPDHEHVNIEQTYVLEGSLVDKEGPATGIEAKTGEFIWREPGLGRDLGSHQQGLRPLRFRRCGALAGA